MPFNICDMFIIDKTIISEDIFDIHFVCDLDKCMGACCVEGDAGAPLLEEEIGILEDISDEVKQYMVPEGIEVIETAGTFDYDEDGNFVTPLIGNRDCAYVFYDEEGIAKCAIEKAFEEGCSATLSHKFKKPVSCHLYPVRISQVGEHEAVNYHKWHICKKALKNGKKLGVPLYKFLREPLIRYYGQDWYDELLKEGLRREQEAKTGF